MLTGQKISFISGVSCLKETIFLRAVGTFCFTWARSPRADDLVVFGTSLAIQNCKTSDLNFLKHSLDVHYYLCKPPFSH